MDAWDRAGLALEALSLTLYGLLAARVADGGGAAERAAGLTEDESRARAALEGVAATVAAAARSGLLEECRRGRRRMAASARAGETVRPEPSAEVGRADFSDIVKPVLEPGAVLIESHDGRWLPFTDAMRDYVERAVSDPSRSPADMVAEVARRASSSGLRVRTGGSGAMELTGYVRRRVLERSQQLADRDRWDAAPASFDGVEISMHAHCAPDHLGHQGLVYSLREWNDLNGGLDRPIGTHVMGCRHIAWPCHADDRPTYGPAERAEMERASTREVTYTDRHGRERTCTAYEATQRQRAMERSIRKLKVEAGVLERGGADAGAVKRAARARTARYRKFCDEVGIPADLSRTRVYSVDAGLSSPAAGRAEVARQRIMAHLGGGGRAKASAVRGIVGRAVELGPGDGMGPSAYVRFAAGSEMAEGVVARGMSYVPRRMLETLRAGGVSVEYVTGGGRAEFDPASNAVRIGRRDDELTVVHELMHAVEEHDREFLAAEARYFRARTAGRELRKLRDITGNRDYEKFEKAYDVGGSCISPYAFKDYGGDGYELMSMGMETLYRSPGRYLRDPGMLKWVLEMVERFGG